jgi:hypothetical protein
MGGIKFEKGNLMKIKLLLIIAVLCALAVPAVSWGAGAAVDHETIACGNTATGFTAAKITKASGAWSGQQATAALITVENNSIRFCIDGSTPTQGTSGICHRMDAGQSYMIRGRQNVSAFRCIDLTSGSASKVEATIFYGGE